METKNINEFFIEKGLFITAIFSILVIFTILAFIVSEAIPAFQSYGFFHFLTGSTWAPNEGQFGVFPMIIGSIFVTLLSLVIAVPLSLLCAIFMEEIAPDKIKLLLKPVIQTLSGIPSVVYGFFGLTVLVPVVRQHFGGTGFSVFTAALILSVMILPTIISVSQDAIKAVCSTCMLQDQIKAPEINGTASILKDGCVNCSWCKEVCPVDTINVTKPFEGTLKLVETDESTCKGDACHACQDVCPCDAVEIIDNKATINLDYCNLCGACVNACPQNIREVTRTSMKLNNINSESWRDILTSNLLS